MQYVAKGGRRACELHDKTPGANVAAELLAKQVFDVGFVIDYEDIGAQFLCPRFCLLRYDTLQRA